MRIAICYSLPSRRILATKYGETDLDSQMIADKVKLGLLANGHEVEVYKISEDEIEKITEIKAELIFNLIEWSGLDIELSRKAFRCFDQLKIPVTGSREELFVLTGDKARLKKVLQKNGFMTPRGQVFETGDEMIDPELKYPVLAKPSLEHCSMGLSHDVIAHDASELKVIVKKQLDSFGQSILAEEFISGRELLVYLIEDQGEPTVLPIEEVVFEGDNPLSFQTYESKWEPGSKDFENSKVVVAELPEEVKKCIEVTSKAIFKKLRFGGYARFDARLRDGIPYYLETNANPSVYDGDGSLSDPNEEVIPGIKFGDYLEKIVSSAVKVFEEHQREKAIDDK